MILASPHGVAARSEILDMCIPHVFPSSLFTSLVMIGFVVWLQGKTSLHVKKNTEWCQEKIHVGKGEGGRERERGGGGGGRRERDTEFRCPLFFLIHSWWV